MRMHFITRTALLVLGGFLAVVSQIWTGDVLQWVFVGGGAVMMLMALADATRERPTQRALDGLILLLGAWTVVEAFIFDGNDLKWWSFASGAAIAGLAVVGLIVHEMSTERVVHELSVSHEPRGVESRA
ncbi:MAG TPA: hypothetical protein VHA80_07115 [Solirubrobacterales bacterium]|nr:hypothetical protein [Solirubrobacterales bacterium]